MKMGLPRHGIVFGMCLAVGMPMGAGAHSSKSGGPVTSFGSARSCPHLTWRVRRVLSFLALWQSKSCLHDRRSHRGTSPASTGPKSGRNRPNQGRGIIDDLVNNSPCALPQMPESPHVETSRECEIVCYPTVTLYGDPGAIIIFWNTMKLGEVVANQTREGKLISSDLLAYVSPLGWEHINLTGEYRWPKFLA
jgi:hypothetical protein